MRVYRRRSGCAASAPPHSALPGRSRRVRQTAPLIRLDAVDERVVRRRHGRVHVLDAVHPCVGVCGRRRGARGATWIPRTLNESATAMTTHPWSRQPRQRRRRAAPSTVRHSASPHSARSAPAARSALSRSCSRHPQRCQRSRLRHGGRGCEACPDQQESDVPVSEHTRRQKATHRSWNRGA